MDARHRGDRRALVVYALTRTAIAAIAVGTVTLFEERLSPVRGRWDTPRLHELGVLVDVWARWDSDWYLRIAEGWYDAPSSSPAFFPLYPGLVGILGRLLGGHPLLAGVLLSTVCGAVAFVLLHRLVRERFDEAVADRTVLLLALFPTSLFLTAVYSESLFLLLAIGTFVLAERGRLGWAAALAGLALLTRSQGIALLPALALFAWRADDRPRALATLLLPLALFALYPLSLWVGIGEPLAFVRAQELVWERSLDPLGPIVGIPQALLDAHLLEAAAAVLMLPLGVVAWRRIGSPYGVYALVVMLLPMLYPSTRFGALYSFPRLSLVAFPCFVALGLLTSRPLLRWATAAVFAGGLAVLVVRWSLWYWVA